MRHGHASLGLQARPGVGARVRCLGQGWGLGLDREKLYKGLEYLIPAQDYYSRELYKRLMDVQRTSSEAREPEFLGGNATMN